MDSEIVDNKKYFEESKKFIDEDIKNNGNIVIVDVRSSTLLIAYKIKYQEMKLDEVLEMLS